MLQRGKIDRAAYHIATARRSLPLGHYDYTDAVLFVTF
jgi:hypothetical protein